MNLTFTAKMEQELDGQGLVAFCEANVVPDFEAGVLDVAQASAVKAGQRLARDELLDLGLEPPQETRLVWFSPPAGRPIVLAHLAPKDELPAMRIWRVLAP